MKTKKILAIGNSFSQDAARYLQQVAEASGVQVMIWNLYIGGCSLEQHWHNIEIDSRSYLLHINGTVTEKLMTIDEGLNAWDWDYITIQQASGFSGWMDSYEPFLGLLLAHIKEKVPAAQIYIHETWAYEITSTHPSFIRYNRCQHEMYCKLHTCYITMAEKYALGIIPCGTIIQKARNLPAFDVEKGGISLCRDGFHLSYDYGRYLAACVWVRTLFHVPLSDSFVPDPMFVTQTPDPELLKTLRRVVEENI